MPEGRTRIAGTSGGESPRSNARLERAVSRGAMVNALGLVGRVVYPVFLVVVTRLFGPAVIGVYLVATFIGDLASGLATSGLTDATTVFGSHYADDDRRDPETAGRLYAILAHALLVAVGTSAVLTLVVWVGAGPFVTWVYPDLPVLAPALRLVALSLPVIALYHIAIAATKARMHMGYDATILGFVRPMALLVFSVIGWRAGAELTGLILAYVAAELVTAGAAAWAFSRHFRWGELTHALRIRARHPGLVSFAIPQSLNMTFNRYLTRLDVIMLAAFGHSTFEVAFYGTGALITSNVRQIRLIFSSALAPVAARHDRSGDREAMETILGRTTRWIGTIAVPVIAIVVVLRNDILGLFHPSYGGDTAFMLVLLMAPLVTCLFGLAGNCLVFTGHSTWTLINSLIVAAINTGLNVVLIPRYGLMGAAVGTAAAATIIAGAQLVELWRLERVTIRWRFIAPTLAAAAVIPGVVWLVGDPAALGPLALRIAAAGGLVLFVIAITGAFGPSRRPAAAVEQE